MVRLSSADLPLDAKARFRSLFSAKEFWQMSELRPYLGDVVGPGESEDAVLLRHARATMGNGGEEYFSARYDWD